jgi:hypothetical protein
MLVLLIPYRDREDHKKIFIDYMTQFFKQQNTEFIIYIIEQIGSRPFNRGGLINAGFLEAKKINSDAFITYAAHDIDILPMDISISYKVNDDCIKHLYGHTHTVGGICLFNAETFTQINGFPNNYWGWGREDACLMMRAEVAMIPIDRYSFCERGRTMKFRELPTNKQKQSKWPGGDYNEKAQLCQDEKENPEYSKYNGLSTLQYIIKDTAIDNEVIHIKVYLF